MSSQSPPQPQSVITLSHESYSKFANFKRHMKDSAHIPHHYKMLLEAASFELFLVGVHETKKTCARELFEHITSKAGVSAAGIPESDLARFHRYMEYFIKLAQVFLGQH